MSDSLIQKHPLKGRQAIEIKGELVDIRRKGLLVNKHKQIELSMLNPDPVVQGSKVHFHSRVRCSPMITLWKDNPNPASFNAFVKSLSDQARAAFDEFSGISGEEQAPSTPQIDVDVEQLNNTINMVEQFTDAQQTGHLVTALKALAEDPQNPAHIGQLAHAYHHLGPAQGLVLTYAPYVRILLSQAMSAR